MARRSSINPMVFNSAPADIQHRYSMQAKGKSEAEIYLYGDVGDDWFGGVTAKQFADDLKAIGKVDLITVRINSPGGDVFQGLTIYRLLVDHPAKIVVHIDGLAASIASVIAMAAEEIHISEAAFLMVHNAWGFAIGSADEMRTMASLLDKTTASIKDVYIARTGKSAEQIKTWMDAETWFTAQEAVDFGFATDVTANMKLAARVDFSKHRAFRQPPSAIAAKPKADALKERLLAMKAKLDRHRAA
jgi:ATP-dependent Clp protease protease subunit